jgi:hypothetical protein
VLPVAGTVAVAGTVGEPVGVTVMKARLVRVGHAAPWQAVAVAAGVFVAVGGGVGVFVADEVPTCTTALLQMSEPGAHAWTSTPRLSATFTVLRVRFVTPSLRML